MRISLTRARDLPARATLLERPHRFAVICRMQDGEVIEAHLPDPGRLTGTLSPGAEILLDGPFPPGRRKLLWTCVAMRSDETWVGTVSALANRAFEALVEAGWYPELGAPGALRAEVKRGRSRFDFVLDGAGGETWVEVKSVTLARGRRALFPDAVTARGARHVGELAEMAREGARCAVVFVAQRGDVHTFEPARDVDPRFAEALDDARGAGVDVLAAAMTVSPEGLVPVRRLEVLA